MHYALLPGEPALRIFAVFSHPAVYPEAAFAQSRFVMRLRDDLFDTISVDEERTHTLPPAATPVEALGPKESLRFTDGPWKGRVTDKYHYFTDAGEHFVHGWAGSGTKLGCWILYGSTEDQNGGPTKQHNTAHWERILLKILTCGHYGAAGVSVPQGEVWEKFYGPWAIWFNEGGNPQTLRAAAVRQAEAERAAWPPAWVEHPAFPPAAARGRAEGRLVVRDSQAPEQTAAGAWVGLAAPSPDWQQQSTGYQYWTRADAEGRFAIPAVRPGRYTLYAFVDGVLGEFRLDGVEVTAGATGTTRLGEQVWTPVRYGRQAWEIGRPDRTAREFRHGDDHRQWGLWLAYPKDFPDDVTYTIGESDPRRDWNFAQVTRQRPDGAWAGTTWRVNFDLDSSPAKGEAVLRLAFAGAHNASLRVRVNGNEVGESNWFGRDNAVARAGIHGQYSARDVKFAATRLHTGRNVLELEQQAGGAPFRNVMYDYLRLELPGE
ncbi:lyase [Opitutaceae bacterium TAV5]|nr:lyase [Opitutaceae bacterium TAV5]